MKKFKQWGLALVLTFNLLGSITALYIVVQLWVSSVALSTKIDILDKTYPEIRTIYLQLVDSRNILLAAGLIMLMASLAGLVTLYVKSKKKTTTE